VNDGWSGSFIVYPLGELLFRGLRGTMYFFSRERPVVAINLEQADLPL
jgi:hypothetical protein